MEALNINALRRKGIALEMIFKYILVFVAILVGVGIIYRIYNNLQVQDADIVLNAEYHCQKFRDLEVIDEREFQQLAYGHYSDCNLSRNRVILNFPLELESFKKFLVKFNIKDKKGNPLLLFRSKCEEVPGFRGFAVQGKESKVIFRPRDILLIGHKKGTVYLCPGGRKGRGELCKENIECAENLTCGFDYTSLLNCNDKSVAGISNKRILVLGSSKLLSKCCEKNQIRFLRNSLDYFKAARTLIIYEKANISAISEIADKLKRYNVEFTVRKHDSTISEGEINGYDQIWLVNPGDCSQNGAECNDVLQWQNSEIDSIANFVKSGKAITLLVNQNIDVANKILAKFGKNRILPETCSKELRFIFHSINIGVSALDLGASRVIEPKRVCVEEKTERGKPAWCAITASKYRIRENESITIFWKTKNANAGIFNPKIPCEFTLPKGNCTLIPESYTYALTVENAFSRYTCLLNLKNETSPVPPPDTTPEPPGNETKGCTTKELVSKVDGDEMLKVAKVETEAPRPMGSARNRRMAEYEINLLKSYGAKNVHIETFGSSGRNVVGEIGVGKDEVVVIGGHRDTVRSSPGAIDNEMIIPLEAARVLSSCDSKAKANIRFVGFDGEELGLLGSRAYVRQHGNENIVSMMNFDCQGDKLASRANVFRSSSALGNVADKCCEEFNLPCAKRGRAGGNSDHASFARIGVPYVFVHVASGTCGPSYHSPGDTFEGLGKEQLEWAAKLAVCIAAELYIEQSNAQNN